MGDMFLILAPIRGLFGVGEFNLVSVVYLLSIITAADRPDVVWLPPPPTSPS